MTLLTQPRRLANGKEQQFRMVYHNIEQNSFDWTWEVTTDAGNSWTPNWQIHYVRKT